MKTLTFATVGSVDDGKSTLIGRLMHDTKTIFEDHLDAIKQTSASRNSDSIELALLTDGLKAEREQGITIDVAYRYFATPQRRFIVADCPGHIQYTRNMVTGASHADAALLLVDARNGISDQTRRHALLSSLLGVKHLILCVNKMDLVDWSHHVYKTIDDDFAEWSAKLTVPDIRSIPMSASNGDNVVDSSPHTPWYTGAPLLATLETLHTAQDANLIDLRLPIQTVLRAHSRDYRGYAGQLASGVIRVGDTVTSEPAAYATATVTSIADAQNRLVESAAAGDSIVVTLDADIDIGRGDMIVREGNRPKTTTTLDAMVCVLNGSIEQSTYILKHTTHSCKVKVDSISYRLDINELSRTHAHQLSQNDVGRITIRSSAPIMVDSYERNRTTGSFILIDEQTNQTLAGGMVV
jgi:sulfate adenylyltransferase large subunit